MKNLGGWRGWHLEKGERPILRHETISAGDYTINLLTCNTSARMLDWIFQLRPRGGDEALAGLIEAFDSIFRPQANLCSGGKSKRLSRRKLLKLVNAAEEPQRW